jgi:hypothetical protein
MLLDKLNSNNVNNAINLCLSTSCSQTYHSIRTVGRMRVRRLCMTVLIKWGCYVTLTRMCGAGSSCRSLIDNYNGIRHACNIFG